MPDLVDAYHLLNSKGIFPDLNADIPTIDLDVAGYATKIIDQGYQMVDKAANNVLQIFSPKFSYQCLFHFY